MIERPDDGTRDGPPDATSSQRLALKARQVAEASPMWRQLIAAFVMPVAAEVVRRKVGVDLDACTVMASQHVAKGDHVEVAEFRASASEASAIALAEMCAFYMPIVQGQHPLTVPALSLLGVAGAIMACKMNGVAAVDLTRAPEQFEPPPPPAPRVGNSVSPDFDAARTTFAQTAEPHAPIELVPGADGITTARLRSEPRQ